MKKLNLIRSLVFTALIATSTLALACTDKSVRILVTKANDTTAKVMIDSKTYLVPLSFESSSFTWDNVKDGYYITPEFASYIEEGRVSITIQDSGAQFRVVSIHAKK